MTPTRAASGAGLVPKLHTILKEGYGLTAFKADALAGLTVAVVAPPLSMALAIASGCPPQQGLVTAVVAGFLISGLGGSRVQIGGPTGAFFLLVFMLVLAPVMGLAPLASLAAILLVVAWNMSEAHKLPKVLKGPVGPACVLVATLLLTVFVNLMLAIATGVVLSILLARLACSRNA